MQVPGAESAVVAEDKIRKYLLSSFHLLGSAKARFFNGCGFKAEEWEVLVRALLDHALNQPASLSKQSIYGSFYNVDGPLTVPNGSNPMIRSVWILEAGSSTPKLVTAYPLHV
jgi:hypothetical protein